MTDLPASHVWLACAVLLAAGVVQGMSGFGFGLLAVAVLGLFWPDPKSATIIPLIPNISLCSYVLWSCRRSISWSVVRWFLFGGVVGVPLGVIILKQVDVLVIYLGLAALLTFSGVYGLLPRTTAKAWHPVGAGLPMGILSGALGGAFNTGGPPAIAFFSNQNLNRFQVVAALQAVFLSAAIIRLISLSAAGMMTLPLIELGLLGMVAAVAGVVIGLRLLKHVSEEAMQLAIKIAQLALAALYILPVLGYVV